MNNYYVYIYLDPRKQGNYIYGDLKFNYEPFYVGKGKNNRYRVHSYFSKMKRKQHMYFKIRKIKLDVNKEPIVIFYRKNLSNDASYLLEKELINKIGRVVINTGPLINKASGGYGSNGFKQSKETIEKRRLKVLEYYKYNSHTSKGKKRDLKICLKISKSRLGLKYSKESYLKRLKTLNIQPILQYNIKGEYIREWNSLTDIKNELNISIKNINACINGARNVTSGYIWKRKTSNSIDQKININFKITKKHGNFK